MAAMLMETQRKCLHPCLEQEIKGKPCSLSALGVQVERSGVKGWRSHGRALCSVIESPGCHLPRRDLGSSD